jgi:putative membrane protein
MESETPWRGLHPASLAVNLLPTTWRTARASWPLLLALFLGSNRRADDLFNLILLVMFFSSSLARTVTHFATLRYRIHEGKLELRSGLFSRTARVLDPARIQNVNIVQNLFHRMAGLVEVRVETAGESPMEGTLSALSLAEAEALKAELQSFSGQPISVDTPEDEPPSLQISAVEALAFGLTQRSVGLIAVLSAVGFELFTRMSPDESRDVAQNVDPKALGAVLLIALCGSWALSAGSSLLRNHGQRLIEQGERLIIEAGLFTRRRVEIPLGKVQYARFDEPLLRRLLGYGTLVVETASFGQLEGGVRQAEGQLVMVPQHRRAELMGVALPGLDFDPWTDPSLPAHPRAIWGRVLGALMRGGVVGGLAIWAFGAAGAWAFLSLLLFLSRARLEHQAQGYAVTPAVVMVKGGYWTKTVGVLDRGKIQSVFVVQPLFDRMLGLGRVVVRVAGTEMQLPAVELSVALGVLAQLRPAEQRAQPS